MIRISNMNVIAFAVMFLSFVAFSQQQDGDHEAYRKKMHENFAACLTESKVDPELPKKAFKDAQFTDDKNLKCFFKCILEKQGHMDSNGNVDFSASLGHIPPNVDKAKVTAALDKCKGTKGADACDTAFLVTKCFREAIGPIKHD